MQLCQFLSKICFQKAIIDNKFKMVNFCDQSTLFKHKTAQICNLQNTKDLGFLSTKLFGTIQIGIVLLRFFINTVASSILYASCENRYQKYFALCEFKQTYLYKKYSHTKAHFGT